MLMATVVCPRGPRCLDVMPRQDNNISRMAIVSGLNNPDRTLTQETRMLAPKNLRFGRQNMRGHTPKLAHAANSSWGTGNGSQSAASP